MSIKQLWKTAEERGWTITKEGKNEYLLSQYSSRGQDFNAPISGRNATELIESLDRYIDGFDISEEAYLWLDETGHGKNGAPYDMIDVYNDMENCKEMMQELLNAWENL